MEMPESFFKFPIGEDDVEFRKEVWRRSEPSNAGKAKKLPTQFKPFESFLPKSLVPPITRNPVVGYPPFTFERSLETIEFFGNLKLNNWIREKAENTSSSKHRRMHFPSLLHAKHHIRKYIPDPNGKIQVEGHHLRCNLDRNKYRLETIWEQVLGPDRAEVNGHLIPTDNEEYRTALFDVIDAKANFTSDQRQQQLDLWRTIEQGYIPGSVDIGKENLSYWDRVAELELERRCYREGGRTVDGRLYRADLRLKYIDHLRRQSKDSGNIFRPWCEICGVIHGPDVPEILAGFEVAHKRMLASGERDTYIRDLMFLCRTCHGFYTHYEQKLFLLGQLNGTYNYDDIAEMVKQLTKKY